MSAVVIAQLVEPRSASAGGVFIQDGDVAALIAAINAANSGCGPQTIHLATHGTYTLTAADPLGGSIGPTGLPAITSDLTIFGHGAAIQRSDAAGTPDFRILNVEVGGALKLEQAIIRNGRTSGSSPDQDCAGIRVHLGASMTLDESVVSDNQSTFLGGGICNDGVLLVRRGSLISSNRAVDGGGIFNGANGQLEVKSSFIIGNSASYGGGIINDNGAIAHLVDSVLSGNEAAAWGGGISNSTFGGSQDAGTVLVIERSTIAGNTAEYGGGVFSNTGTVEVTSSVIAGNTARSDGGSGIGNFGAGSLVAHDNCIVGNAPISVVNEATAPLLDARDNWWGAVDGPSGNGPGSGDSVSTNVEFTPFRESPAPACRDHGGCNL